MAKIVNTVPMKFSLIVTYEAPVWDDDSTDLDVIAREEKAELQNFVDALVMGELGETSKITFTVEPVFELPTE